MAAMETREASSGDEEEVPQFDDDSDGGSDDGGGSDGGGSDRGGSDGGGSDGDEEGEGEEEEEEGGGAEEGNANSGWAEAMAKILGKKTGEKKKSNILTKSKELEKSKEKEKQEQLERKKQVDKKRTWETMSREKPDVLKDRETERVLQRTATRGVVQLFNAVRKHQKSMEVKLKEVGGSERKKAKILTSVSKKDFIDVLRGEKEGRRGEKGGRRGAGKADRPTAAEEEEPAWSVLRDDYMMGATMKDWDKESEAEEAEQEA